MRNHKVPGAVGCARAQWSKKIRTPRANGGRGPRDHGAAAPERERCSSKPPWLPFEPAIVLPNECRSTQRRVFFTLDWVPWHSMLSVFQSPLSGRILNTECFSLIIEWSDTQR
jgi:hypothetical protein